MTYGVDVSTFNKSIDYNKSKENISFNKTCRNNFIEKS